MPYSDPERRREYQRAYSRRRRAGLPGKSPSNLPRTLKVTTARDVLELLSETIGEVRKTKGETFVKARVIAYLAGVTLKAVETANLEVRLEAVEESLKIRKAI